ncbi:LOW QUALITY PROTEIN: methyltransferase-like protein 5 [Agrilus planipennis]|uniref:Methyltransferase-like protein 5 n=1 Tax=Agrilus planipennis TaxID=224129 RepID=A0A1W4WLH1_AGRPL|nr:LOW QUALITY PROTEIN: methyltransferase-like protein 5 [Agrilus planipennis]
MAFSQPNAQRELTNRKILEELQLKKQLLLKQGVASTLNSSALPVLGSSNIVTTNSDGLPNSVAANISSTQRAALQQANSQSMGFFITQDSSFGNLILPVIPRFEPNKLFIMFPCMKLKHLQELLEDVEVFEKPKIHLEQYVTPSHLSSHMMYTIQSQYGDLKDKLVADLGSGCGSLSVGASVLGAGMVVGFEIDQDALEIFRRNMEDQELFNVDVINMDVFHIPSNFYKQFDTVVMNPPFGTKYNSGIDMQFLKTALQLSTHAVYSLHKTSTRKHVIKIAEQCGANAEVLAELRYDLPSTYKFHKRKSVDIEVDFYRFLIS